MNRDLTPDEQQRLLTLLEQELTPDTADMLAEHTDMTKAQPITAPGYRLNFGKLNVCVQCTSYSKTDSDIGRCLKHDHIVRMFATCLTWRKRRARSH